MLDSKMSENKEYNAARQNEPKPMPRKSKIFQSSQDKDRDNEDTVMEVTETKKIDTHSSSESSKFRDPPEATNQIVSFDDTPITVTNKSFSQLVEEELARKLRENTKLSQPNEPKKSFLRKGVGLAKYHLKNYHDPSSIPMYTTVVDEQQHMEDIDVTENATECHDPPKRAFLRKGSGLKKYNLKPITGHRKKKYLNRVNSNQTAREHTETKTHKQLKDTRVAPEGVTSVYEDISQAESNQSTEEKLQQLEAENSQYCYHIKELQRKNHELKEENRKLKEKENLLKKVESNQSTEEKLHQLEVENVQYRYRIEELQRKIEELKEENRKPKEKENLLKKKKLPAKQESRKTKVIKAVSNQTTDHGNEDGNNSLVIHEVVPRKPIPFAIEHEAKFQSTLALCQTTGLLTPETCKVNVHVSHEDPENCNIKITNTGDRKVKDHRGEECQEQIQPCDVEAEQLVPPNITEDVPEVEQQSEHNVTLPSPDERNTFNSLTNKKYADQHKYLQTRNTQECTTVKKSEPENGNSLDITNAGTNSQGLVHCATEDSNLKTEEINVYISEHHPLTTKGTPLTTKESFSTEDQIVASDAISSDRITHTKTHPDGRKVIWYNNGCVCKISSDGMTEKIIYYNGDVLKRCLKSKTEMYYFCKSKIWCTTYHNGVQLVEFPNGQSELKKPDGTIKTNYINGSSQTIFPDGRVEWDLTDGRHCKIEQNGDKTWFFPNGQKEIHTKDHKRREYPDGTVKYVYPDGSMKTEYASGRVRVIDKFGKLIMDTDLQ